MSLPRALFTAIACVALVGCQEQQPKKMIDVKTPIGDVEVLKDEATGEVSVDVSTGDQ